MSLQKNAFCAWCQAETPHNVAFDKPTHTFELTCDGHGEHVIRMSGNVSKAEIDAILEDHAKVFKGWKEPVHTLEQENSTHLEGLFAEGDKR